MLRLCQRFVVATAPIAVHTLFSRCSRRQARRDGGACLLYPENYEAALGHLERAYTVSPGQQATAQLLGEAYAILGDPQRAATIWHTVDLWLRQLELRHWWYDHIGDQQRANWVVEAATLTDQMRQSSIAESGS